MPERDREPFLRYYHKSEFTNQNDDLLDSVEFTVAKSMFRAFDNTIGFTFTFMCFQVFALHWRDEPGNVKIQRTTTTNVLSSTIWFRKIIIGEWNACQLCHRIQGQLAITANVQFDCTMVECRKCTNLQISRTNLKIIILSILIFSHFLLVSWKKWNAEKKTATAATGFHWPHHLGQYIGCLAPVTQPVNQFATKSLGNQILFIISHLSNLRSVKLKLRPL